MNDLNLDWRDSVFTIMRRKFKNWLINANMPDMCGAIFITMFGLLLFVICVISLLEHIF